MKRCCMILLLLLAGCGPGAATPFVPTETPNPMAFFVPTEISPGREENPLRIPLVPRVSQGAEDAATTLETALSERTGLTIDVLLVDNHGDALRMLCDYTDDIDAAPFLSGPAWVLADAGACGDTVLQVVRAGETGLSGEVIGTQGVSSLSAVSGRNFCRLTGRDFYSWVLPGLMMEAGNVDISAAASFTDYDSYNDLLVRVANGDCDMAAVPADVLEDDNLSANVLNSITTVETSIRMPFGVLVYPPDLLLGDREVLTETLLDLAGVEIGDDGVYESIAADDIDQDVIGAFQILLGDGLALATPADFEDVQLFMEDTGLDLAGLGRS